MPSPARAMAGRDLRTALSFWCGHITTINLITASVQTQSIPPTVCSGRSLLEPLRALLGCGCGCRSQDHLLFLPTGELATSAPLDREQKPTYHLVAKATDGGGRSCQADIMLSVEDTNDNAPRFFPSHCAVAVFDNTTTKTPIAVVAARDLDEGESGWDLLRSRVHPPP